jgi:hypothetical protein
MDQLRVMGIEGVSRYLSYVDRSIPMTTWPNSKILLKPEYDQLIAAGFMVTLNWEWDKDGWTRGYQGGLVDGREARRQARALGAPDWAIIIQSVDTNPHPNTYLTALEYQRGFNDGGGLGPQGMYATDGLLRRAFESGLVKVCWQTMSRGWHNNANDCPYAQIIQRTNHGNYDMNDLVRPHFGAVNECLTGYRCVLA